MSELTCDLGKLLNKLCNKVDYVVLKTLGELGDDTRHTLLTYGYPFWDRGTHLGQTAPLFRAIYFIIAHHFSV